jgi:hypothetical protein
MPANQMPPTNSSSRSAPVEGIRARRDQRVLVAVGKAFGVLRTQRDPETGVYHVLFDAEQSLDTITSSPAVGIHYEVVMVDDLISLTLLDQERMSAKVEQLLREVGL